MKIGFIIPVVGIFGSVREVIENSNEFVNLGYEAYIFNSERESIEWTECKAKVLFESKIKNYDLDLLILACEPNNHYLEMLKSAKAKVKAFCMMGFDQNKDFLTGYKNLNYIIDNYFITADSQWQIEWFKENTTAKRILDSQLGGVNLELFQNLPKEKRKPVIGWSGDPRERKGGAVLIDYFEKNNIEVKTYFKKRIPQKDLKNWFSTIDIFVDNHNRGGWCNPVAEAMSTQTAVICSETKCNSDFTIHGVNCLKFPENDMKTLDIHLNTLLMYESLRLKYAEQGRKTIENFSYKVISKNFINEVKKWL